MFDKTRPTPVSIGERRKPESTVSAVRAGHCGVLISDRSPGDASVRTPFLLFLAGSALTKKTIQEHVHNLWILGGEIIRDLQETPKLRKKPANELIDTLLESDDPLIYHCDSEEQQRSFECTCRKLRRYLSESVRGACIHPRIPRTSPHIERNSFCRETR